MPLFLLLASSLLICSKNNLLCKNIFARFFWPSLTFWLRNTRRGGGERVTIYCVLVLYLPLLLHPTVVLILTPDMHLALGILCVYVLKKYSKRENGFTFIFHTQFPGLFERCFLHFIEIAASNIFIAWMKGVGAVVVAVYKGKLETAFSCFTHKRVQYTQRAIQTRMLPKFSLFMWKMNCNYIFWKNHILEISSISLWTGLSPWKICNTW